MSQTTEDKIRLRVSYKTFEKFSLAFDEGNKEKLLRLLYEELDNKRTYGSMKGSLYAQESLELFLKDDAS